MTKFILTLISRYILRVATVSRGGCWVLLYSEKIPENFDNLIDEIRELY